MESASPCGISPLKLSLLLPGWCSCSGPSPALLPPQILLIPPSPASSLGRGLLCLQQGGRYTVQRQKGCSFLKGDLEAFDEMVMGSKEI